MGSSTLIHSRRQPLTRVAVRGAAAAVALMPAVAAAQTYYYTIGADSGWYDASGYHDPTNTNYLVGRDYLDWWNGSRAYRNFFVQYAPTRPVIAAEFRVYNTSYSSSDPFETFALHDVSTDVTTLRNGGSGLKGIYNDLGDGTSYGSVNVSGTGTYSIALNSAALAMINGRLGQAFALGGALTTISGTSRDEFIASGSGGFAWHYTDDGIPLGLGTNQRIKYTLDPNLNWTNAAGGTWSSGGNWAWSAVPTPTDNAIFDLAASYTVNFDSNAAIQSLKVASGSPTFHLGGKTLTLSGSVEIGAGSPAQVDALTLKNGTFSASAGPWVRVGWDGTGSLTVGEGATMTASSMQVGHVGVAAGAVHVAGTSAAPAILTVSGNLDVGNNGVAGSAVNVGAHGKIDVAGTTKLHQTGGKINLSGGTLRAVGGLETSGTLGNTGGINFTAGTLEFGGALRIHTDVAGAPAPLGNNLTINSDMTLRMIGDSAFRIGSNGPGSVTQTGGELDISSGRIESGFNGTGGNSYHLSGGIAKSGELWIGGTSGGAGGSTTMTISGTGSMTVSGPATVYSGSSLAISGGMLKASTLNLQNTPSRMSWTGGTLWLASNVTHATGDLTIPNGGTLKGQGVIGSSLAVAPGATVNIDATGTLSQSSFFSVPLTSILNINSGTASLGGSHMSGSEMRGQVFVHAGAVLDNVDTSGVFAWGGRFRLRGGELRMSEYGSASHALLQRTDAATLIEGHGTLSAHTRLTATPTDLPATLEASGGTLNVTGVVGGGGTVRSLAGSILNLDGGNGSFGGVDSLEVAGTTNLGAAFIAGVTTVQAGGMLNLESVTLSSAVSIHDGGTLAGAGTVSGSVSNGGVLSPGSSPGVMNVSGNLSGSGNYLMEIASLTSFDQIDVTGTISFAGSIINVDLLSYSPDAGESFDLFDFAGSIAGTWGFDFADAPLAGGLAWDTSSFATTGGISIVAVPEPGATGVALLTLGAALLRRRLRRF